VKHGEDEKPLALPEAPDTDRRATFACLSLPKTGSVALTAALRAARFEAAAQIHYLGPRFLALRTKIRAILPPVAQPALQGADILARRDDPTHRFHFVTSVRDPIGCAISQYFQYAAVNREKAGIELPLEHDAFIDRYERYLRDDLYTDWFDDTYRSNFGFDFRAHPFDHRRGSLRFEGANLKLVILRQEDADDVREAELGWLVGRDRVEAISRLNETRHKPKARAYAAFLDAFVAPDRWLRAFYETTYAQHFYTPDEVAAFRAKWSRRAPAESALLD
jgi:hypothetical protein